MEGEARRVGLLRELRAFDEWVPQEALFKYMALNVVDENYYAWFMRYIQMACFELKVDLSVAQLGVRVLEDDHLRFIVAHEGREVHFTGRVVGFQIVLAYRQVPALQEGLNNEQITKDGGTDLS